MVVSNYSKLITGKHGAASRHEGHPVSLHIQNYEAIGVQRVPLTVVVCPLRQADAVQIV